MRQNCPCIILIFIALLCCSCKSLPGTSEFNIINGTLCGDLGQDVPVAISSVVMLKDPMERLCSGTVISEHVLLTAAHCVLDESGTTRNIFNGKQESSFSFPNKEFKREDKYDIRANKDFALVYFDKPIKNISKPVTYPTFHDDKVEAGTAVLLVGYGELQPKIGSGRLRCGKNVIKEVEGGVIVLEGRFYSDSSKAIGGSGDSGAPLFNESMRVIGINANGDALGGIGRTRYAQVCSESFKSFIKQAKEIKFFKHIDICSN